MADDGVRISPTQVYEKVLGMEKDLGEIKTLLETHIAVEQQRLDSMGPHVEKIPDLEQRIVLLERDVKEIRNSNAERDSRKPRWWETTGAIVGIIGGLVSLVTLFMMFNQLSQIANQIAGAGS